MALDKTVGFPNKISSTVKKRWQGYDMWKGEHVIWLEYRTKVNPGIHPPRRVQQHPQDVRRDPIREAESMAMIRELLDVMLVLRECPSRSTRSRKSDKRATTKIVRNAEESPA